MLRRFAAASSVASVIVAARALVSVMPRWSAADARVLTTAWCFVPLAWGLWALLAPAAWVPGRLPLWGAILGALAGIVAGPVLDLPARLVDVQGVRWITLIVGPVLYYVAWLLVPVTWRAVGLPPESPRASRP